jgi:hypothetical protein
LGNVIKAATYDNQNNEIITLDYRVMQPWMITDINDNRSAVSFDILGTVIGTAIMGKVDQNEGDSLNSGFEPDLDDSTIISHIQNPFVNPHYILNNATVQCNPVLLE